MMIHLAIDRPARVLRAAFLLAALVAATSAGARAAEAADWDRALPALELRHVDLAADSLPSAWQRFSTRYLVRSMLVVGAPAATSGRFRFKAARCRARDVLDALVKAYPDFAWGADPATGILWIRPRRLAASDVLPARLRLARDYCAVPLHTGVLLPLAGVRGASIVPARWGTAFTNTFDVGVDLAAGDHSLHDLLGLACQAHPAKTFFVRSQGGRDEVTPVHLGSDRLSRPPAGALLWWKQHFGSAAAPATAQLARRLASPDAAGRGAAREYLDAVAWQIDLDRLVETPRPAREAAWVAIGVSSVVARHPQATHRASRRVLERLLAEGKLAGASLRPLALLAELQRARLAGEAQSAAAASGVALRIADLASILDDLLRLASTAGPARELLKAHAAGWAEVGGAAGGRAARCLADPARPLAAAVTYEIPPA